MFKKWWILLLLLLLSNTFALTGANYGKLISMETTSFNPSTVYPGDIVTLNIDLKNRGASVEVLNLSAKLSPPEFLESIISEQQVIGIGPSDIQTIVFKFKVKENCLPGTYNLPVTLEYDKKGFVERVVEDYNVLLEVKGFRSINIKNIRLDKISPHIGDNLIISASIENNGSLEARNVIVSLTRIGQTSFGDVIPLTETSVHLNNIGVGESKPVSFKLFLSKQLEPDTFNFKIDVNMLDIDSTESEKISFEVKGRPELILSGVDFSIEGRPRDKKLMQNDSFSLSIQLENIGKETAKAVEVKLEVNEGITGMKESYVGNIDADDSGAAIFDLSIQPTAIVGDHKATITVSYIDELNQRKEVSKEVLLYVHAMPPPSPISYLVLIIIILVIAWFVLKQVNRFMSIRKR